MKWTRYRVAAALGVGLALVGAVALAAAPGPRGRVVPLLRDPAFDRGFRVFDPAPGRHVVRGTLKGPASAEAPVWGLSQWNSRFTLAGAAAVPLDGGAVRFADDAKCVTFGDAKGPYGADLGLALDASKEYGDRLRRPGEPWPHLLAEQRFETHPSLAELEALRFRVEVRLCRAVEHRREGWTPALHAAQFQAFVTVQNLQAGSPGYGDYLWFGIAMYDSRHRTPKPHAAVDTGGTGKFIYTPGGEAFTDRSVHDCEWVAIDRDLLPMIRKGLATAWEQGHLKASRDPASLRLGEFNIGWELPGTVDAEMQIRGLALEAHLR